MILWQNPNPTSSFDPQTITALDMDSFKYIGIKNKPYDTASNTITHIYSIDEFKKLRVVVQQGSQLYPCWVNAQVLF